MLGRGPEWWTEHSLRFSVITSAALVAVGFALALLVPELSLLGFAGPRDVINAGLLILIGGSVFRVAAASVAFLIARDHALASVGTAVFIVLMVSLFLGKVE